MPGLTVDDLRYNEPVRADLKAHHLEREGSFAWFYADNMGYVTIGIGHLVKTKEDARALHGHSGLAFTYTPKADPKAKPGTPPPRARVATADDLAEDWQTVTDHYKATKQGSGRKYETVSGLRLSEGGIDALYRKKVDGLIERLYTVKPFMRSYDARIAAAFVDVAYNPTGLNPWNPVKQTGVVSALDVARVQMMWRRLNPWDVLYDPQAGLVEFASIWGVRGGKNRKRYMERHMKRSRMFLAGMDGSGVPAPQREMVLGTPGPEKRAGWKQRARQTGLGGTGAKLTPPEMWPLLREVLDP